MVQDWIPDLVWLEIVALSAMDSLRDLPDSVVRNDAAWHAWYDNEAPERAVIPDFQTRITKFARMCVVKVRPRSRAPRMPGHAVWLVHGALHEYGAWAGIKGGGHLCTAALRRVCACQLQLTIMATPTYMARAACSSAGHRLQPQPALAAQAWTLNPKPCLDHAYVHGQAFREDRTLLAAADFIAEALGQRFIESVPLNLERALVESAPNKPLICLLSAGTFSNGPHGILPAVLHGHMTPDSKAPATLDGPRQYASS